MKNIYCFLILLGTLFPGSQRFKGNWSIALKALMLLAVCFAMPVVAKAQCAGDGASGTACNGTGGQLAVTIATATITGATLNTWNTSSFTCTATILQPNWDFTNVPAGYVIQIASCTGFDSEFYVSGPTGFTNYRRDADNETNAGLGCTPNVDDETTSFYCPVTGTYRVRVNKNDCANFANGNVIRLNWRVTSRVTAPGPGSNVWNHEVYNSSNYTNYLGYYTTTQRAFESRTRWGVTGTPSSPNAVGGAGYNGCAVSSNGHSTISKRTGFPSGSYSLFVNRDDNYDLLINGASVSTGACCGQSGAVWTGTLNASSTVELRHNEGTGDSYIGLSFNQLAIPTSGSNSVACGTHATLVDNGGVNGGYSTSVDGHTILYNGGTGTITVSGVYETEATYDFIRIYSGAGIGGTLLATWHTDSWAYSSYTGAAGQTLTVRFSSDGGVERNGFVLDVTTTTTAVALGTVGSITSSTTMPCGGTGTYSIPAVSGANTYSWVVTGGTIASGQGTTGITVNWGTTNGAGSVTCNVSNDCYSGSATLPIYVFCGCISANDVGVQTAACGGAITSAANSAPYLGNYKKLDVINGVNYSASTCGSTWDTELTVTNASNVIKAYNQDNGPHCATPQASVDWTSDFSGVARLHVSKYSCNTTWDGGGSGSAILRARQNTTITNTTPTAAKCQGSSLICAATIGGTYGTSPYPTSSVVWSVTPSTAGTFASQTSNGTTGSGITFTPTAAPGSTFTITASIGVCSATTASITISPNNSFTANGGSGALSQTVCINSPITNISYATTGVTGVSASGLPTGLTASYSANTVTISGSPTVSGSFPYTITPTGGCNNPTPGGTITVNPVNTVTLTSAVGTNAQTKCINTAITNITYSTTGATGITSNGVAGANGLPAGVSASWAANTITISGTPTATGTFNYSIPLTGGCGTINATGSITVNSTYTSGAILTTGQTICYNGDPTTIGNSVLASGGNGVITYEWRANGVPIPSSNGSTYDPPAGLLTTTSYTRWAKDGSCSTTFTQSTGSWLVTVNGNLTAGTIGAAQTICYNTTPSPLTETAVATGGTGSYTYKWYSSPNGSTWTVISGATSIGYSPGALTATTHYYREVTSGACGTVNSAAVIITVFNQLTPLTTGNNGPVCVGSPLTLSVATVSGATYAWTGPGSYTSSSQNPTVSATATLAMAGTYNVVATVSGCPSPTGTTTVTVNATKTAGAASSTPTLCISTPLTAITHTTTGATGISSNGVSGANGLPAGVSATWASNLITISGTPTASGTFSYSIALTGGCGTVNATGTITVTANKTAGTASSTPTLCISTALTAITHTTTGATGISNSGVSGANGLPAGVSATWASNLITISGTPSVSGTFSYSIPLTGGCGTVNATGTISVTANKTAGTASSTPTLCVNTALTAITHTTTGATGITSNGVSGANGLPAGVSATWASNLITISGTPTASGTFSYSIPLTGGCGTVNATGTITVNVSSPASVSIVASSSTICPGTSVTFTATPTNGGTTPAYQWRLNGVTTVGTNSNQYTTTTLANGNSITVIMTSNATCPTGSPATSNAINITVISPATPAASVTAQPTCATPGGTITISSPTGAQYEYALNGGTYQASPTFTGLSAGNYSATVRLAASPTCVSSPGPSFTINSTPSALPAMATVFVCQGGTGYLVSNNNCINNFVVPFNTNTIYHGWMASGDPTAAVPAGALNTATCAFGGAVRTYSTVQFQVSITGNYIFEMNDNTAYNGVGYIYTGTFTPGSCASGTLVRADSDAGVNDEPQLGGSGGAGVMTLTAGVTYTLVSSTEGGTDVTANDYRWTITPPSGGNIMLNEPGSVQWYTVASGGSVIGTGETFNPVGVSGSGLANTNTSGTTTYYAACSSSPTCRTAAAFTITSTTTLYNITPSSSSTCYNASVPVSVGISGSVNSMVYRLMRDGVSTGIQATGTGAAITVGNTSVAGDYTVVAVVGSCLIPMNGTVVVKPVPIANAGSDVSLCGSSVNLSGSSNSTTLATEDFGNANVMLTPTTSDWRIKYLYNNHPANRTEWYISYSGASPNSYTCVGSGSGLVTLDHRTFQPRVPCDYAWDDGVMDEIAYKITSIDTRLYTSVNVSFDYHVGGNYSGGTLRDYMQVMYSLDNGVTWVAVSAGNNVGSYTMLRQLNGTTNAFFGMSGTVTGTANVAMPSAVAGGSFLLGFRWTNDGSLSGDHVDNMMIDNIVVTGAPDYSWSPTTGVTNSTTATPTVTIPGTYTVTVTAGNGCSATDNVVVKPKPTITGMSTSVCSQATFTVTPMDGSNGTVPAGTTYTWSAPSVAGITGTASGTNAANISGTLTNTTNAAINVVYTVTPTGNTCTGSTFTVTVTVNPKPTINPMTASACSGAGFTVSPVNITNGIVPSSTTYTWSSAPAVTGGLTGGATGSAAANISGTLTNPTTANQTATYTVTPTAGSCSGTAFTATVTINPTVTAPSAITFTGTEPSCQLTGAGITADYNSTASAGTLQWSLTNITTLTGSLPGTAINSSTGVVTWSNGWSGSVTINVVSTGCAGPTAPVTRLVSVTSTVGTPTAISISAGSEPPCQLTNGSTSTTYSTTATNNTGFNWSISNPSAGSINPTTGVMTWTNNFSGSVNIQVTASGCNGPSPQVIRTVNVGLTVGTPAAITAGPEPVCQLTNGTTTTTYSTTASNSTALNWSISNPAAGVINSSGVMTWANGFYGTVDIRVTASGCNGPSAQVTRTVVISIGVLNAGFRTWTGLALNRLWQDAGNWDCGGVPTATDRVIIPETPVAGVNETPIINSGITGNCFTIEVRGNIADRVEIRTGGNLIVHQ